MVARRLKGKPEGKGKRLQAALGELKYNERINAKKIAKATGKAQPKVSKDVKKNQKKQAANLVAHQFLPFEKDSKLLLVGEGDFSYARSILEQEYVKPSNLIVTSYDNSLTELRLKYPRTAEDNYNFLVNEGVAVHFKIDATNLIKSFKINKRRQIPLPTHVIFNFPHTGRGIKDQDRNIREHQELMLKFFQSSEKLMKMLVDSRNKENSMNGYDAEPEMRVVISVFTGEPYDSWNIKTLAKHSGWKLETSGKFQWENYPGYEHRRTNSEQTTTKVASEREARSYVFERYSKQKHSKKKDEEDSDEE